MRALIRRLVSSSPAAAAAPSAAEASTAAAAASSSQARPRGPFPAGAHGLGLANGLIVPHLGSIRQLPEVSRALEAMNASRTGPGPGSDRDHEPPTAAAVLEDLERAAQVFAGFAAGGGEHAAALALLAEARHARGLHEACASALLELEALLPNGPSPSAPAASLRLARAKTLWYGGDARAAKQICDALLLEGDEDGAAAPPWPLSPVEEASARTGQALSRLLLGSETLDDVFTLRDPFRMSLKALERGGAPASPLHLALAHLNYGVAEAVYAAVVEKENGVSAPTDPALRSWNRGLTAAKRASPKRDDPALKAAAEARLLGNMAWGLLRDSNNGGSNVERASDYAGKALKLYDLPDLDWDKGGLGRTLALVATCYHRSGSAVTSEGLLQSAVDDDSDKSFAVPSPLQQLEVADACTRYADLCRDWERREGDARRLDERAERVRASLPLLWQSKPAICGSLWFWTPSLR